MAKMRTLAKQALFVLLVIAVSLWVKILSVVPATSDLKVAFLSVGQGDAIYIEAPNGRQMIIDGGPKGSLVKELKKYMPPGDTSVDVIMVTNPDADHYAGFLELLDAYSVGAVIEPGVSSKTKTYQSFQSLVSEKGIRKVVARKDVVITLDQDDAVSFTVLFPDRKLVGFSNNDASTVGRLVYGQNSILFTGDATRLTESLILKSNSLDKIQSDILKVGHHGSRTSTSEAFLKAVQPRFAVISAGKGNKYGHPHQEIVQLLKKNEIHVFVTKESGTVLFRSDGVSWKSE